MIRVILVDDHAIVRTGIAHILGEHPQCQVVAEMGSGEEAIRAVREHKPNVVLMDLNMPGIGGLEATSRIHATHPEVGIIILTVHANAPYPKHLLEAGATGYLTKGCAANELYAAIETVARGGRYVGSDIAQQLALGMMPGGSDSPFDALTARETSVMLMLIQGHSVAQAAEILSLSPKTVATYKYRLFNKVGVNNAVELSHLAIRHGITDESQAPLPGEA